MSQTALRLDDVERDIQVDDIGKEDHTIWSGRLAMDPTTGYFEFDMTEPRRHAESASIANLTGRRLYIVLRLPVKLGFFVPCGDCSLKTE